MTYDAKADALAIDLADAPTETMRELAPGVSGDFDASGRLTSIEILGASLRYPVRELKEHGAGAVWLTIAQAAKEAQLSPDTLRKQLNAGRLKGKKIGRDWQVSRTVLWNYLESRAPSGKPSAHGKRVRVKLGNGRVGVATLDADAVSVSTPAGRLAPRIEPLKPETTRRIQQGQRKHGKRVAAGAEAFRRLAAAYGLKPTDLGKTFHLYGGVGSNYVGPAYVVIGLDVRSKKHPILTSKEEDGKSYRLPAEVVRAGLEAERRKPTA